MNLGEAIVHFKGDDSQFKDTTDNIKNNLKSLTGITQIVGASMVQHLGMPMFDLYKNGVKYNAELESYSANLSTLLGGNEKEADKLLKDLKEMAKTTPYETSDLIKATQTMMSFGLSSQETQKHLKEIGDIAMGDKQKMSSLSLAFSQMSSAGKLTGQDLLQMINAGFNPLNEISKMTGKSVAELKEEMSKGAISSEMVAQAFSHATQEGGLFYKGMEKGSQTTEGKISTLKDSIKEMEGSLAEALLPVVEKVVEALTKFANWVGNLSEGQKKAILTISGIILGIGGLLVIITKIIGIFQILAPILATLKVGIIAINMALLSNPIALIIAGIVAFIGILVLLWNKCEGFKQFVSAIGATILGIGQSIANGISSFVQSVINAIQSVINFAKSIPERVLNFGKRIRDNIKSGIGNLKDIGKNLISGLWKGVTEKWDKLKEKVSNFGKGIIGKFKKVFGISSPSKEFAKLGKFNMMGLEKGMEDYEPKVQRAIDGMFNLNPSVTGSMSQHLSPTILVNNQISMETDPLGQVVNKIKTYSGGAKNDYNWGTGL